jgi:hypothetical protein
VASQLQQWLSEVQVLADPEQRDGDRVWTRAQDLLPAVVPQPGTTLTAAWGSAVWLAVPEWDEREVDTLWLRPLSGPITAPRAPGPPDQLGANRTQSASPASRTSRGSALHPSATELLEDFDWCLALTAQQVTASRDLAGRVLDELERHCPEGLVALEDTEAGREMRAWARRPAG